EHAQHRFRTRGCCGQRLVERIQRAQSACPGEHATREDSVHIGVGVLARLFERQLVLELRQHFLLKTVAVHDGSPVGTMPAFSTMSMIVRFGARVRWSTPLGTTKPWPGSRGTSRPSMSTNSWPSSTKKNSSSSSCLCQWYSPWTTPIRTTEPFTLHRVW